MKRLYTLLVLVTALALAAASTAFADVRAPDNSTWTGVGAPSNASWTGAPSGARGWSSKTWGTKVWHVGKPSRAKGSGTRTWDVRRPTTRSWSDGA